MPLRLVQPISVQPSVVRGVQNLGQAIAVEVGHDGIGHGIFDDIVIFAQWGGAAIGNGDCFPVVTVALPAATVGVEDERHFVEAGVGTGTTIIDITGDDDLLYAIAVDVGHGCRGVGKVGPVFSSAVGIAA